MDVEQIATDAYVSLRLIAFVLRLTGILLLILVVLGLVAGRNLPNLAELPLWIFEIGTFVTAMTILASAEGISLMVNIARNSELVAESGIKTTQQLSRMMGEAQAGERVEPRLF
jgi:hypothetical protein